MDQLSDNATCRLPRRTTRLPPSPPSGLFQQQPSPALAWWEPFTPGTRPSSPRLRPYFSELGACATLDANVKAHSSDAPSETDLVPFFQSSQLFYTLIPASDLSMGPISTHRPHSPWRPHRVPRSITLPTPPHTLPAAHRDLRPWHSSRWRNHHTATSKDMIKPQRAASQYMETLFCVY